MFRKIVSNLNFSPALVGQLGFYAKRLKQEEATRRLGLIFTALALVVQSFAVFTPPEAANAASAADFISGGVRNKQEFMGHYDNNTNRIKGLFTSLGITRAELASASPGKIGRGDIAGKYNWSRTSLYSAAQGERSYAFDNGAGKVDFFYRPLSLTANNPPYDVIVGNSAAYGWFAIKMDCANLITKTPPPPPPVAVVSSVACTGIGLSKISPGRYSVAVRASKTNANITGYTLKVDNQVAKEKSTNDTSVEFEFTENAPGEHSVQATVHSNVGSDSGPTCKATFNNATPPPVTPPPTTPPPVTPPPTTEPAAVCSSVKAIVANRVIVSLSGSSAVANGATVSGYTFSVKDASGAEVKNIKVNSAAANVTADSFELSAPGSYSVQLVVQTSIGDQSGPACQTSFNIVKKEVCQYNPALPPGSPDCQPCPGDETIWIKDEKCKAEVVMYKTAKNMTQNGVDASSVIARASDKISYTLTVENKGLAEKEIVITEKLDDVTEYATLVDQGGGNYDQATKTLSWPSIKIAAGQKQTRTIALQVMEKIPITNTGASNPASYDCKMINTFGNTVAIDVECAPEKIIVEQVVNELPHTGARENTIFAGVLLAVVVYFYARSRQLGKEVRLVRRGLNAGTI